jgi:hypothetical protein
MTKAAFPNPGHAIYHVKVLFSVFCIQRDKINGMIPEIVEDVYALSGMFYEP